MKNRARRKTIRARGGNGVHRADRERLRLSTGVASRSLQDHQGRQEPEPHLPAGRAQSSPKTMATESRSSPSASSMTYRQYDRRGNQYARWAMAHGVQKGDVVALMMPNRPEYLAVWLGVARAGGVTALLNTNLTGTALAHCVNIVKAEARHRRRRAHRQLSHRRAAPRRRPGLLVPRRRAGRLRAARHTARRSSRAIRSPTPSCRG